MKSLPENLSFTRLSLEDTARMSALHALAFPPGQAWDAAAIESAFRHETTHSYAIEEGGALISFVLVQCVADQAEILTLATDPAHRRRGIAQHLLAQTSRQFAGSGIVKWLLDVAADNPGAIAFYESLGFTADGRRRHYYKRLEGARVDAILMSMSLRPQGSLGGQGAR